MQVVCSGFYGHGNVGDEAIARALSFYLQLPFSNVQLAFATELPVLEAKKVMEQNPFYYDRELISVFDLESIKDPDIVLVGGGDLSAVYGIQQTLKARESGRAKLIARIGTSAKNDFFKGGEKAVQLVKSSLELFDFISVRDRSSFDVLAGIGLKPHIGADLALDIAHDSEVDLPNQPYVIVTVRSVRRKDQERQADIVKHVLPALKREIENIFILPFCQADYEFSQFLSDSYKNVSVIKVDTFNPNKISWIIANAEYVVSIGRLHPLVFAIGNRVPCFAVTYPWIDGYDKINGFMHHAGLGSRVTDYAAPIEEIGAIAHDSVFHRKLDQETIGIYSGYLKGLMLESLCPVWQAMGVSYGLGLERGLRKDEFRVDDYDDSYFFGARTYKAGSEFRVYHPTRGDWEGWDIIADLIMSTMSPITLMDAGCGRGWFLKRMVEAEVRAEGIDSSRIARRYPAPKMEEFIKSGFFRDLVHRRYDVVTSFDVMEHIYEDEIDEAIKSLKSAAARYIVLNICAASENERPHTIKRGKKIPDDLEWLAVSGHVTIRHRSWWKAKLEDSDWEIDEKLIDTWFQDPRFNFTSWQRHNFLILKRKEAV